MEYLLRIVLIIQFSIMYGSVVDPNSGWSYVQSTGQTFYMLVDSDQMTLSDVSGNQMQLNGDGTNTQTGAPNSDCVLDPSNCDALGAFKNHDISQSECNNLSGVYLGDGGCDVCVGWVYFNSYNGDPVVTTLAVMGNDNSGGEFDYYLENDDVPKFKVYDSSESITYSLSYSLSPDLAISGYAINEIYVYYADCLEVALPVCEEEISNDCCVDATFVAECQYDTDSDGICDENDDCLGGEYDCAGVCDGDAVEDCAGECNGSALVDECGECQGDNSSCTGCMDSEACNFDENATIDGGCVYPEEGQDCDGNELDNQIQTPSSFDIISVYPNPFNPSTHIKYSLDVAQHISIAVLNSNGNEVKSLFSGSKLAGFHNFTWAPEPSTPSGQYFIQISTQSNSLIKKVTFIK